MKGPSNTSWTPPGTAPSTDLGTGMDAWQQAVRDRCAQLRKDAEAGRLAENGLDEFDSINKQVGTFTDELFAMSRDAYVTASVDLNGFEHQSQGALASADVKVREKALAAREAIEQRRIQALRDAVLSGVGALMTSGAHLPRLKDLAEAGQRAAAELRDLEKSAVHSAPVVPPGRFFEITINSGMPREVVEALEGVRYPSSGGRPGDIHRDAIPPGYRRCCIDRAR